MKELKIDNQNLSEIINDILCKSNRIFVSEADFQFYLAWELKKKLPSKYKVVLEYPREEKEKTIYIDIAILNENEKDISYIELKYKTVECKAYKNIKLKDQAARDLGNYLFLKDVSRMENQETLYCNYCIFLTGDKNYWEKKDNKDVLDYNFKLFEDKEIGHGKKCWNISPKKRKGKNAGSNHWTKKYPQFNINHDYKCTWKTYTTTKYDGKNIEFKYLLLTIPTQK